MSEASSPASLPAQLRTNATHSASEDLLAIPTSVDELESALQVGSLARLPMVSGRHRGNLQTIALSAIHAESDLSGQNR
jgi:hypothetical protein